MSITEQIGRAQCLAEELMRDPPCTGGHAKKASCLALEEDRPLTAVERRYFECSADARRCFSTYNSDRFCPACRAYWHASMAEVALRKAARLAELQAVETEQHPHPR